MKALKAITLTTAVGTALVLACLQVLAQTGPTVTVNPGTGPPNTLVVISGSAFPPNEIVGLYLDTPNTYIGSPGPRADAQGKFTESDVMPGGAPGKHKVCADTSKPTPQVVAAKVCVPFELLGLPSPTPAAIHQGGGASLPVAIVFLLIGVLVGVGIGAAVWSRR